MFNTLIKGFFLGFISAMPLGPVGIICMRDNITKGIRSAGKISLGSIMVDFFYLLVVVLGITSISKIITINEEILKTIGGLILIYIGVGILVWEFILEEQKIKERNLSLETTKVFSLDLH